MLIATIDKRHCAFYPTPKEFPTEEDYLYGLNSMVEMLEFTIYMENKLLLNGIDLSLMEEDF